MQQSIRIHVGHADHGLLVATSPDLPRFQVIGLSVDELRQEVPAAVRAARKPGGTSEPDETIVFV